MAENQIAIRHIAYRAPFDWEACLAYYAKHRIGDLEHFHNNTYTRTFMFNHKIGMVCVSNDALQARLEIKIKTEDPNEIDFVLDRIEKMFDLSLIPMNVVKVFSAVPFFKKNKFIAGTRLVGCWDNFELAITTILGQLISTKQATGLTAQLLNLYGEKTVNPFTQQECTLFPTPDALANDPLSGLKIPQMKKKAIASLSKQVLDGSIDLFNIQDPFALKQQLMKIYGIGKWTTGYIALRAMGDTDAFPEGDVFLEKAITKEAIQVFSPFRGYLASYLYKYGVD